MILFVLSLPLHNKLYVYLACSLMGAASAPIMAVALDFGCETTFPVPANNSTGVQLAYSQFVSVMMMLASSWMLPSFNSGGSDVKGSQKRMEAMEVLVMMVACLAAGFVCSVYAKEDLKKTRYDKKEDHSVVETQSIQ